MTDGRKRTALPLALLSAGILLIAALGVLYMKSRGVGPQPAATPAVEPAKITFGSSEKDFVFVQAGPDGGPLALVNGRHPLPLISEEENIPVYGNKTRSYKVKDRNVTLNREVLPALNALMDDFAAQTGVDDIIVTSGFRSFEAQRDILNQKISGLGERQALLVAAQPGESEHHTGYALDIGIYTDDGVSKSYRGTGTYAYINRYAHRYGFILRYPAEKSAITGISEEPWHFRYVGVPHAQIICQMGFCLEEYIDYLRDFPYDGRHLLVGGAGGKDYEIYFAPKNDLGIPVPREREYAVSGNNAGGYIVTIPLG